ncbi:hypothetical protein Ctob_004909 [Chrysochromulina tobinii]|uniref:CARD domain-containing protein n=1 Tax=Chrysochromulina tobinii TaxID=1460289 RepID=A0A0M0JD20_9EUKA|nr:hypothetical protein Ctob_004909 [Chrysochromulina tobinii]|eukprot:KOO24123.1 hypothetical protein Ctob_004909 [Chrysochromulina sp. CCMP291]
MASWREANQTGDEQVRAALDELAATEEKKLLATKRRLDALRELADERQAEKRLLEREFEALKERLFGMAHAAPFSARMAHALQYIMDQLEARETFEGVERDRVALMERSKEKIIRLQLDLASVRETGDAARAEFDETLDAVAARISAAEARCREARRGVERVEGVALGAVASLEASAEVLSNPVVCNQLPDKVRGAVLQRTRQLLEVKLSMSDLKMVEAVMYASVNESALCALILSMGWDADQMAQLRPERAPSLEEPSARARNNRIPHLRLHELQRNGGAISPTQLPEISPDAKYSAHELKAFQATLRAETAATAAQEASWQYSDPKLTDAQKRALLVPIDTDASSGSLEARMAFKLREYSVLRAELGVAEANRRASLSPERRTRSNRTSKEETGALPGEAPPVAAPSAAGAQDDANGAVAGARIPVPPGGTASERRPVARATV